MEAWRVGKGGGLQEVRVRCIEQDVLEAAQVTESQCVSPNIVKRYRAILDQQYGLQYKSCVCFIMKNNNQQKDYNILFLIVN